MGIKLSKFLISFLLLTLSGCVSLEPQQSTTQTTAAPQTPAGFPSNPSFTETVQPSMTILSTDDLPQATHIPSPSSTVLPPPYEPTPPILQISQLRMFDINTGWAVYSAPFINPEISKILRSMKRIQTWIDVTPPTTVSDSHVRSAFFADANTAIVVSSRSLLPVSADVEITPWRSIDAGKTWQSGDTFEINQASEFLPSQLFFIDPDHGWMLGESDSGMQNLRVHILETQDGGMHWKIVYDSADHLFDPDTLWIKGYYPYLGHLSFITKDVGFFSDGRLLASKVSGKAWTTYPLEPPADFPNIDCKNGDCKYLDTVSSPRFTSSKDGTLIRRVYSNTDVAMDVFVYYPNTLNRLPLPDAQYIYFTQDGGQTWVPKLSPVKLGTMYFLDAKTGWLLGKSDPNPATTTQLYLTTDSGDTWTQVLGDCPLFLGSELQFLDDQIGYAFFPAAMTDFYKDFDARIKNTTLLFSTKDGGRSWVEVEPQVAP